MLAHRGHQQLGRQLQVFFFKGPAQRSRVLDEVGHLLEQALVDSGLTAFCFGCCFHLFADRCLALVMVGCDKVLATTVHPVGHAGDGKLLGCHEAVTARQVAAGQVAVGERDHLTAIQGDDPVHRPGKTNLLVFPAHRFFERQTGHQAWQDLFEQFRRRTTGLFLFEEKVFALVGLDGFQCRDIDALAAGKADRRLGRVAVAIKGNLFRRAHRFRAQGRLVLGDIADRQGKATGRSESFHLAELETRRFQLLADHPLQISHRLRQKTGGDLFAAYFKEYFLSH